MPHNRYFYDDTFKANKTISLDGEEFYHMVKVMRVMENEIIEIINGKNQLAKAKIIKLKKTSADILIQSIKTKKPSPNKLILHQALIKPSKLELVIEKATEIGVDEICLFPATNSQKGSFLSNNKKKRLKAITISAIKQCSRLDLPKITYIDSFFSIKPLKGDVFFGDIREKAPKLKSSIKTPCHLFIGPEMGFSNDEISYLENTLNATGIKFNPFVLRSETASIIGMGIMKWLIRN